MDAEICPVDDGGNPEKGKSTELACDTLLLSIGLIPENELSKQAGIVLDGHTGGPLVDEHYQTSISGIFAAGNALQVFDLVDEVSCCALSAGRAAARFSHGEGMTADDYQTVTPGRGIRSVVPQRISLAAGVDFHLRSSETLRNCTLELTDGSDETLYSKRLSVVRPSEMFSVTIPESVSEPAKELKFRLQGDRDDKRTRGA